MDCRYLYKLLVTISYADFEIAFYHSVINWKAYHGWQQFIITLVAFDSLLCSKYNLITNSFNTFIYS